MEAHNLTLEELIQKANSTANSTALELIKRLEANAETQLEALDASFETLKDAYLDKLATEINRYVEEWDAAFEKGGQEFVAIAECYDFDVAENVCGYQGKASSEFEQHVLNAIETAQYLISGGIKYTHLIDSKAHASIQALTDDQWDALADHISQDIPAYFDTDTVNAMASNHDSFYSVVFGEQENQIDDIAIFSDIPDSITDDDINRHITAYKSGDYLYLDKSYEGVCWSINLDYLEQAVFELFTD